MSSYVFISYSRKNAEVAHRIVSEIEGKGQAAYIDTRDIPPGAVFADAIVGAIENSECFVLLLSTDSNISSMVLNEVNAAANHNKMIIPLLLEDRIVLTKAMEFYLGKTNWIAYADDKWLESLIKVIQGHKTEKTERKITYPGPIVLRDEKLRKIEYDTRKKVIETIEIDYRTLGDAPMEFIIDDSIEGTPDDWMEYVNTYPETASYLVVNDKVVGYSQIEMISDENYAAVISGEKMINAEMQEFYGFGGEFCLYIVIMPILSEYENQKNYLLLFNDLMDKLVFFYNEYGMRCIKIGISVYTNMLAQMVKSIGFKEKGRNPAKGRIFELELEKIAENRVIKSKYKEFYKIYTSDSPVT